MAKNTKNTKNAKNVNTVEDLKAPLLAAVGAADLALSTVNEILVALRERAELAGDRMEDRRAALSRLREGARGDANLMPLLLNAVEAYATLGEICGSLRQVFGEFQALTSF